MAGHHSVLVVDDDEMLRCLLVEQIKQEEQYTVLEAVSLSEADAFLKQDHARIDALLLDVTLPDGDGRDFCKKLRHEGINIPVIMMTGSHDEEDIVRGLDSGANDYVIKPFRSGELRARLRAQLRSFANSEDVVFDVGPYIFRPANKKLIEPTTGRRIHLTEKETAILKYLYRVGHRAVSRDVLLNEVWGYNSAVTTHTLETHIYRLRQKIEQDNSKSKIIATEGGGYILNSTVKE